jgi:hypothetical protein
MRPACCGCTPPFTHRHAVRVAAIGLLLSLTACAFEKSALRRSAGADDPREPWSPNYGTAHASRTAEPPLQVAAAEPTPAATPAMTPARVAMVIKERFPLFGAQPIDEDDTIRRAIAAHEMRRED